MASFMRTRGRLAPTTGTPAPHGGHHGGASSWPRARPCRSSRGRPAPGPRWRWAELRGAAAFLGHLERVREVAAHQRLDGFAFDDMVLRRVVLLAEQQGIDRLERRDAACDGRVGRIGAGRGQRRTARERRDGEQGEQQESGGPGGPVWRRHRAIVCPRHARAVPSISPVPVVRAPPAFSFARWPRSRRRSSGGFTAAHL